MYWHLNCNHCGTRISFKTHEEYIKMVDLYQQFFCEECTGIINLYPKLLQWIERVVENRIKFLIDDRVDQHYRDEHMDSQYDY